MSLDACPICACALRETDTCPSCGASIAWLERAPAMRREKVFRSMRLVASLLMIASLAGCFRSPCDACPSDAFVGHDAGDAR